MEQLSKLVDSLVDDGGSTLTNKQLRQILKLLPRSSSASSSASSANRTTVSDLLEKIVATLNQGTSEPTISSLSCASSCSLYQSDSPLTGPSLHHHQIA